MSLPRKPGPNATGALTTGQVARRFKISLQTLHFYDDEGLVIPERCDGRRIYDQASLQRLAFVLEKKRMGLSLAKIALILAQTELVAAVVSILPSLPSALSV